MKKTVPLGLLLVLVLLAALVATPFYGRNDVAAQSKGPEPKKVGLMARVGFDLANLYEEYQAYVDQHGSDEGFKPSNPLLRVIDDRVVIDAVASGDAAALSADLEALGLQEAAAFGRMVSGRLPISAIGVLATLDSLKSIKPAYAATRGDGTTGPRGE